MNSIRKPLAELFEGLGLLVLASVITLLSPFGIIAVLAVLVGMKKSIQNLVCALR